MWVKLKGIEEFINLDHVWKVEIRSVDGLARIHFINNRELVVTSPKVSYLGKEYSLLVLLSQAPWTMSAMSFAAKKQIAVQSKEDVDG